MMRSFRDSLSGLFSSLDSFELDPGTAPPPPAVPPQRKSYQSPAAFQARSSLPAPTTTDDPNEGAAVRSSFNYRPSEAMDVSTTPAAARLSYVEGSNAQPVPMEPLATQPLEGERQHLLIQENAPPDMTGYILCAACVFFLANPLFGALAFILAVLAMSSVGQGDYERAKRLGRYSVWVSIAGLLMSVVAVLIYLLIVMIHAFGSAPS